MENKDPFDVLMNAGSDPELWILIAGPVAVLLILIAIYAVIVAIRNRRERAELQKAMELEDAGGPSALAPVSSNSPDALDDDEATPYEIPAGLESVELSPDEAPHSRPHLRVITTRDTETKPQPAAAKPAPASDVDDVRRTDRASWLARLRGGLAKTRDSFRSSLGGIFSGKTKIDKDVLERLHEALYRADLGVSATDKLVDHVRDKLGKDEAADWDAVSAALKERAEQILTAAHKPLTPPASGPWVILVVGVNGVGKTTTIGKLAAHFLAQDKTVLLCAADTFRAAAIEQLSVWGERLGVDVVKHKQGSDPAAVAYDAVKAAIARKSEVLLIDTAGRLHAKAELMAELGKINRIIGRDLPGAPHETWLVIDATTGQNAVAQVKHFSEVVSVSGLAVTKLDGTAKGGVLLSITEQFKLPIRYVGVGEKAADLREFLPKDFVDSLF